MVSIGRRNCGCCCDRTTTDAVSLVKPPVPCLPPCFLGLQVPTARLHVQLHSTFRTCMVPGSSICPCSNCFKVLSFQAQVGNAIQARGWEEKEPLEAMSSLRCPAHETHTNLILHRHRMHSAMHTWFIVYGMWLSELWTSCRATSLASAAAGDLIWCWSRPMPTLQPGCKALAWHLVTAMAHLSKTARPIFKERTLL